LETANHNQQKYLKAAKIPTLTLSYRMEFIAHLLL